MPVISELKARVPVKLWTEVAKMESAALDQLKNTASLPFVFAVALALSLGCSRSGGSSGASDAAVTAPGPARLGSRPSCHRGTRCRSAARCRR